MKILEGKTVKLRDNENNIILPRTLAKNVHMADGMSIDEVLAEVMERLAALEEYLGIEEKPEKPEEPETPVEPEPEVEVKVEDAVIEGVEEFVFDPEVLDYELQPAEGVEAVTLDLQMPEGVEVTGVTVNEEPVEVVMPLEVQLDDEQDTVVKVTADKVQEEAPASETAKVYTFVFKLQEQEEPEQPEEPETPVEPEPEEDHTADLRIAQYYGAGGKTDGMLTCDFIELYNAGEHDVPLKEITLNYTKMGKNADSQNQWMLIQLPDVVLPAHHSFLIQGQMNREFVEGAVDLLEVPACDMESGLELDNGAIKLVMSKATEAYPAGHVDPFEIDETIIDHVYAAAEDKLDRLDVEPLLADLSKNKGAMQVMEDVWEVADYKDDNGFPTNADLLPHNMAHGAHTPIKVMGPNVADEVLEYAALEAVEGEFVEFAMMNAVEDFDAAVVRVNGKEAADMVQVSADKVQIKAAMLLEKAGSDVEIEIRSAKYYRVKFVITVKAEPLAPILYGYIPLEVGTAFNITAYSQITTEVLEQGVLKEAEERVEGKIDLGEGLLPEGTYLLCAVRADLDIVATKDDGFGGHVAFYEEVCGANGVVVEFDGVQYRLYGEFTLTDVAWYIYMD